ncbi:hypothetical protein L3Q82_005626 [Scortum barcoo]|uniref:Uncharacterized protein n=1 Tax=Scortum barcoo TaxID=214431 RepID=A0ACB8V6C6_9TELE|nr:hypothetical protein L3Q82_005626 [Scortum barcoo]
MSPFLYSLLTHDCRPADSSNTIIKFADDTTVIGLIKDSDEAAYREEVDRLAEWCDTNNLLLNTGKTKELIVDFRRNADPHTPIHIKGMTVERVNSFKFLGVHISEDLTWTTGCSKLVKKAHQRLFFLRTLRKNHLSSDILVNFYRCTIESILTSCITVWYGSCSAADRKALQRVVKAAQRIAGAPLPSIEDIYRKRCLKRAGKIIKDSSHPAHRLFTLLPSGKRYRSARTKTTRVVVLLKDEPLPQSEVKSALEQVFIQDGWYWPGIGLVMSGAWFPPNMTPGINAKEFNLCLIRPENFVSHGLRVLQVHFGKLQVQAGCHVPFDSGVASALASLPYRPDWWIAAEMVVLLEGFPLSTESLDGRPALGRVLVVLNIFHLWMMEATVLIGTFKAAEIFLYPSPDLCCKTILSLRSTNSSFDFMLGSSVQAKFLSYRSLFVHNPTYQPAAVWELKYQFPAKEIPKY